MEKSQFLVTVDAICGAGLVLLRGQVVTKEQLQDYAEDLLKLNAIAPIDEASVVRKDGEAFAS